MKKSHKVYVTAFMLVVIAVILLIGIGAYFLLNHMRAQNCVQGWSNCLDNCPTLDYCHAEEDECYESCRNRDPSITEGFDVCNLKCVVEDNECKQTITDCGIRCETGHNRCRITGI